MSEIKTIKLTDNQIILLDLFLKEFEEKHNSYEFSLITTKADTYATNDLKLVWVNVSIDCKDYGEFAITEFYTWFDNEISGICLTNVNTLAKIKIRKAN